MVLTHKQYLLFWLLLLTPSAVVPDYLSDTDVSFFLSPVSKRRVCEYCFNVVFDVPKVVDITILNTRFRYISKDFFTCFVDLSRRLGFSSLCPHDWGFPFSVLVLDVIQLAHENDTLYDVYLACTANSSFPCVFVTKTS